MAFGVGHPTSATVSDSPIIPGRGLTAPPLIASVAVHVGQPAGITGGFPGITGHSAATRGSWSSLDRVDPSGFVPSVAMPGVSFQSRALAVGQPNI